MGLLASPVMADDTGFYVGANVARVLSTYRRADLDQGLNTAYGGEAQGFTLGPSSVDKTHVTWSADVGYMLSRNFGVEASYLYLGSLRYSAFGTQTSPSATTEVTTNIDTKSHGPALALLGVLPMSNLWELHARLGAYQGRQISTYTTINGTNTSSGQLETTSTSIMAGVGAALTLSSHYQVRLDYLRLQHLNEKAFDQSFNVDLLTAGVTFFF
jgi:OmpA family protein